MLEGLMLMSLLAVAGQTAGGTGALSHVPEQLAVGAIREIISAQAVHKQSFPQIGYACGLERLVETQMLLDTWLAGKRVDGYVFRIWCDAKSSPQATFRASGAPSKKAAGSTLTVCADESNVPRTIDGDVASCFAKGVPAK